MSGFALNLRVKSISAKLARMHADGLTSSHAWEIIKPEMDKRAARGS